MDEKDIISKGARMQPQQKKATLEKEAEVLQLIIFNLGDEEYGTNINQVREIIRTGTITPIPDSPDFIKGVSNVRGEIPVIIDLKARFFLPQDEDVESKNIVITEQEKNIFGLLVDEVTEVLRIPETEVKTTPELVTRIDRTYISGVITIENRLIILLDLAKVLSEEELAKLAELAQRHRATEERREVKKEEKRKEKKRPAEVSVEVSAKAEAEDTDQEAAEPQPVEVERT